MANRAPTARQSWRPPVVLRALLAFSLAAGVAVPLEAQYFGRNRVNYETFDFRILKAPRFDVYFYPAESTMSVDAARMLERWYARLSPFLRHEFGRRSVILFADQADFQQNNVVGIESEGTGGVTEGFRERVILPSTGVYADNDHVLGHELVHVFQYDMSNNPQGADSTGDRGGGSAQRGRGLNALPLWLVEGMAEYLSLGRDDANTAMWLRDAARRNDVPTIRQLTTDPRYFPYRYGQALWAYVGGRYGDETVVRVFRAALRSGFEPAIKQVLGLTHDSLSKDWAAAIRGEYLPLLAGRTAPDSSGTQVIGQRSRRGGEFNTSPVISPDGRTIAFFSSRGLFGIDIYIADATTGEVIRQLGSVNSPRHYDALSFINSAGAWSPDGRRLAYVVYRNGDQVLEIYNLDTRSVERRIAPPGLGAAVDPAWSPDGRTLAFVGMAGGITDLYLYDFASGRVDQATTGRNAELQPSWSPDGRSIAFATDRGEDTDMERLTFGRMRLAVMDVASRDVRLVPALARGKAINPQYSPDGGALYFIGDPDGIADVYRLDLASSALFRVTNVATGVSGISALSPALSVARQSGRVVFSVFDHGGYNIVRLDGEQARGRPVVAPAGGPGQIASILPPSTLRVSSDVAAYLANSTIGLPPATSTFAVAPYNASLRLDYIAPPTVGASFGGPVGTQLGGGIAASFSDQLGNRNLFTVLQVQGEIKDIGAQVAFQNLRNRWNYGVSLGRIPYLTGFAFYDQEQDGTVTYNEVIQRIYIDQASIFTQYPLSTTRRLEASLGGTRQSYSVDVRQLLLNDIGQVVGERQEDGDTPSPLTYAQGTLALVGDYSFQGFTSPVAGGRYRFQVAPTLGELTFTSALADYRRYLFARPVTFAVRAMHFGRYGRDAEDSTRLFPLFVGYPQFVRGYDVNSFEASECVSPGGNTPGSTQCPAFNRLQGSRIAVASAEIRIPLLGTEALGLIRSPLPLELSPFVDVGVAWNSAQSPEFRFVRGDEARVTSDRVPVFSAGLSGRVNLFGFAVLEAFYAYPFQRPEKGAHFGFQLAPGW